MPVKLSLTLYLFPLSCTPPTSNLVNQCKDRTFSGSNANGIGNGMCLKSLILGRYLIYFLIVMCQVQGQYTHVESIGIPLDATPTTTNDTPTLPLSPSSPLLEHIQLANWPWGWVPVSRNHDPCQVCPFFSYTPTYSCRFHLFIN